MKILLMLATLALSTVSVNADVVVTITCPSGGGTCAVTTPSATSCTGVTDLTTGCAQPMLGGL
jgi:hypothetical protein